MPIHSHNSRLDRRYNKEKLHQEKSLKESHVVDTLPGLGCEKVLFYSSPSPHLDLRIREVCYSISFVCIQCPFMGRTGPSSFDCYQTLQLSADSGT